MLKKLTAILLCLIMVLSLCVSCKPNDEPPLNNKDAGVTDTATDNAEEDKDNNALDDNKDEPEKEDNKNEDKGEDKEQPDKNTVDLTNAGQIICFGDSITEGMLVSKAENYPSILQKNLGEQIKVINAGVSGETSNTILSRANAIDFTLTNDVKFAAGESEVILNYELFSTKDGEKLRYRYGKLGNELSAEKVKIDGKAYTLKVDTQGIKEENQYKFILTRENSSAALTIKKGVKVEFDYSGIYDKRYCTIALVGANDNDVDVDELINRYKKIAATSEKFIAIIPHYGTDYTKEFTEAFGDATVNLREYCKEDVWKDYDYEKTKKDEYYMSGGYLPAIFSLDGNKGDCHLSALGYRVLGDLIYKKGVELGYWN